MEENDHCIAVTHFINPHLFWYKKIGEASNVYLHVLTILEEKLQELYKNKPSLDNFCRPAVGDIVAVNFVAWNKFIRAEVLQKAQYQKEEFVVWAIDYGFPLLTKKEYVREIPAIFKSKNVDPIHRAGMINIEPAEQEYNIEESDLIMNRRDQWLQKPCDMLEKLISDAASISFVIHFETSDNHHWGDLIITNHKGHKFNARDYLLKTTHALEVGGGNFRQICLKLKTTQIAPWLSNDRKTKFKFNSIKHNYAEHSKQVNAKMIDEFAKRKVEDWQARNERKQIDELSESLDSSVVFSHDNTIDDITFEDSVSVVDKHDNYIGKAGALSKIKQQKYSSKNALPPPPSADLNAFQLDSAFLCSADDIPWPPVDETKRIANKDDIESPLSSSTNVSIRIQKLAEMRVKHARTQQQQQEKEDYLFEHQLQVHKQQELPLLPSAATSIASSGTGVSLRMLKLMEMRKKHAQAEEEKKKCSKEIKHNVVNKPFEKSTQYIESTAASTSSSGASTSVRLQKLTELRKNHAREEEKKFGVAGSITKENGQISNVAASFEKSAQVIGSVASSTVSSVTADSVRKQKLIELRKKHAQSEEKKKNLKETEHNLNTSFSCGVARVEEDKDNFDTAGCIPKKSGFKNDQAPSSPLVGSFEKSVQYIHSAASSAISSDTGVSLRLQKLSELRKKYAREEEEKKKLAVAGGRSNEIKQKHIQNDTTHSNYSHSTNLENYPYQSLERSTNLLSLTDSMMDKTQDTKSEISVKNSRAKHLSAMRKKLQSPSIISDNETFLTEATIHESPLAKTSSQYKENLKMIKQQNTIDENISLYNNIDFKLKPKINSIEENKACEEIVKPNTPLSKTIKTDSQSAYDGLTMIPAGFDIARLQTYRDEENHWHRKKTTRYDRVPHNQTVSSEEFLLNTHDQSSSSSDFFQMKPHKLIKQNLPNQNILDTTVPSYIDTTIIKPLTASQQCDSSTTFNAKTFEDNFMSSEISTSSTSTLPSQKLRKRRQLKSPTSQLTKIDQILWQHDIEKKLGNSNILDLKMINSSPQKSLLSGNISTDSFSDNNTGSNTKALIESRSIGSLSSDKISNEKRLKEVSNYTTLMEVKHTDHLPRVEGERTLQTKFIDHLVLAHSSIPLSPIENIAEAPFLPEIHEEMQNMHVNKVYRIQVYSWSHLLRGNSLFVVNPARSGKTWSYLPPLCSLVCYRTGTLKPSYGPVAIILVASSRHVELVNNYCRRLMCGLKAEAPSCVPSYGMRNFIETKIELLNSCGILVTTPSCLLRLLHDNDTEPLFDAERLHHIIIDDMDIMLSRAQEDFKKAVGILFKMSKKSQYKTLVPQLIVTSRDWDGLMIRLIRKSNQPLLLIGDFLEAAVYGRATVSVKLKSSSEKNDTILKFIKKLSQSTQGLENRMLIMCNEDDDVTYVVKFLQECGYPCLGYYNRSTENELAAINEWKNKVSSLILVCTDDRFRELKIQNVQNLIHYSMPTSWTRFTTRFSALARTYENFVSKNFEQPPLIATSATISNEHVAHSMILLDEDNSLQLPRLVDFMRKHNQTVHDDILSVSKRVLIMREESRIFKGSLLCPQLLEFGECDETRCDNRHQLTRFDVISKNDDIPCDGEMRIHILKVFSPTYYAVRLLQHKALNSTKWVELRRSSETLKFTMQLDMHYRNENNLYLHWPPHFNDLCIYKYADNFRRARILDAPDLSHQKNANVVQSRLKVTLKLIDDGTMISSVKCSELFVCDDKFKDFPAQAVDIRLINIVPFDNERSWDSKTTKQTQKWIMEDIKPKYVVQASINFSLANTIWVNNVVVMEKLTGIDAYSQVVNLKKSLIEKNFAMVYRGDRKHVREIAEEYGLLNVSETKLDDDSDLDYQSCQNDSLNLIKFSSSNADATNSSMESANAGKEIMDELDVKGQKNVTLDVTKTADVLTIEAKSKGEENWDDFLDDGQEREEVFVPLRKNSTLPEDMAKCKELILNNNQRSDIPNSAVLSKEETWSTLPLNELVKVEIGDEGENGNWENIFLQIIDKKSRIMFDDLKEVIDRHVNNVKANKDIQKEIYDFEPLQNCLVKYNNLYLRAKVHGVFGENVDERLYRFFLCDYACFANAKSHELYNDFFYETTEEIVKFMPYQAIHSTLVGIQWDRFTKKYQVTKDHLYACAVLERNNEEKSCLNLYNLPIHSYKILMYECEIENNFKTALLFNKTLIDNGITMKDEDTKHFLEYEIDDGEEKHLKSSSKEGSEMGNKDIMVKDELLSCEEFLEFAQNCEWNDSIGGTEVENIINDMPKKPTVYDNKEIKNTEILKDKPIKPSSDSEIEEEQGHCTSDSNSKKSSISLSSSNTSNHSSQPPPLTNLHKRPLTTWYENDCMIFLSIQAPDVKDYLLQVTQKIIIFAAEIQGEKYVLILNLLGSVNPQYVSHEIKGLNVVVRLLKNVFEKWPRLLEEPIKYPWLKYNFNAFDSKEIEHILPQQRLHTVLESDVHRNKGSGDNDDDDDSDSEREQFQTYNPIQNLDDDCDPFS